MNIQELERLVVEQGREIRTLRSRLDVLEKRAAEASTDTNNGDDYKEVTTFVDAAENFLRDYRTGLEVRRRGDNGKSEGATEGTVIVGAASPHREVEEEEKEKEDGIKKAASPKFIIPKPAKFKIPEPAADFKNAEVNATAVYGRHHEYRYRESGRKGRLFNWAVPDDFDFPKARLQSAWFAYLVGWPNNRSFARDEDTGELIKDEDGKCLMVRAPIRPLRLLDDLLPRRNQKSARLKKKFKDDWRPVLKVMHNANRAAIANISVALMDSNFLQETFNRGLAQLKLKHPQIFDGTEAGRCHRWSIATWNTYFRNAVRKNKAGAIIAEQKNK